MMTDLLRSTEEFRHVSAPGVDGYNILAYIGSLCSICQRGAQYSQMIFRGFLWKFSDVPKGILAELWLPFGLHLPCQPWAIFGHYTVDLPAKSCQKATIVCLVIMDLLSG